MMVIMRKAGLGQARWRSCSTFGACQASASARAGPPPLEQHDDGVHGEPDPEHEQHKAQLPIQDPAIEHDAAYGEREHAHEHDDVAEHAFAADREGAAEHGQVDHPRNREAHGHVEDVGPDGRRHGHVPVPLQRHEHGREEVRDGGAPSEERHREDDGRDACELADHFRELDHEVAKDHDPRDGEEEAGDVAVSKAVAPNVWNRAYKHCFDWPRDEKPSPHMASFAIG
mmetsp:Transcript_86451/g.245126  ORF Transcript_86451/g.245126 Transcript_86451/m.245126 type:complete len:228 (-) Transcript_86451:1076-1759(-)